MFLKNLEYFCYYIRIEKQNYKNENSQKNTWYYWLVNYIPEPIRKSVGGFKDIIVRFLRQRNTEANCVWERKETKQTKNTKH